VHTLLLLLEGDECNALESFLHSSGNDSYFQPSTPIPRVKA
jgi:hypothetical protein